MPFLLASESRSPEETFRLGREIGLRLVQVPERGASSVLALIGELGGGKTTFTKGLAAGLGVKDYRLVTSPTFVLKQVYEGARRILHYDAYRLQGERELLSLGFEEDLATGAVVVIEWADRVLAAIPETALMVEFEHDVEAPPARRESSVRRSTALPEDPGRRRLTFRGERTRWEELIEESIASSGA